MADRGAKVFLFFQYCGNSINQREIICIGFVNDLLCTIVSADCDIDCREYSCVGIGKRSCGTFRGIEDWDGRFVNGII